MHLLQLLQTRNDHITRSRKRKSVKMYRTQLQGKCDKSFVIHEYCRERMKSERYWRILFLFQIKRTYLLEQFSGRSRQVLFTFCSVLNREVHWIMEGMEFLSTMVESLSGRKILFVYCIDTAAKASIKFNAVPCFRFNYVMGHCSFPDMLRRRFIVLFADCVKTRDSLNGMTSPAVIEIQSSCLIKVKD